MANKIPQVMMEMLLPVAEALGEELLPHVAFVGGTTTALLVTDLVTRQAVRFTEDVDLILSVDSKAHWYHFQEQLRARGFKESMEENLTCRMLLNNLKVDFMPDDASILGFSNRWYKAALATAQPYALTDAITINLLTPAYFIATKLEAYQGRGNNAPMSSHDLEDIINLVDGRPTLGEEIKQSNKTVRHYIAEAFSALLQHPDFDYAVQGNLQDANRTELLFNRWEAISTLT